MKQLVCIGTPVSNPHRLLFSNQMCSCQCDVSQYPLCTCLCVVASDDFWMREGLSFVFSPLEYFLVLIGTVFVYSTRTTAAPYLRPAVCSISA